MLPNGGNVSTISLGQSLRNTRDGLIRVDVQALIKTADGKESTTIDFARFIPVNSTMSIGMVYLRTNSIAARHQLASLNNTLMVYKDEAISPTQAVATFWKWK